MTNNETQNKRKRSPATLAGLVLIFLMIVLFISLAMFTSFDEVTNRLEAGRLDITLIEPHWDPEEGEDVEPNKDIPKDPAVRNDENTPAYVFLLVTVPYDDMTIEYNEFGTGSDLDTAEKKIMTVEKMPYYKFEVMEDENAAEPVYRYDPGFDADQMVYGSRWKLIDGPTVEVGGEGQMQNHLITVDDTTRKTYSYLYAYMIENSTDKMQPLNPTNTTHQLFDKLHVTNFREILEKQVTDEQNHTVTSYEPFPTYRRDYSVRLETFGIQANFLKANNQTEDNPYKVWEILKNSNSSNNN